MLRASDYRYFDKARNVATISDYKRTHVGCVAVYQGQVSVWDVIVIRRIQLSNTITSIVNSLIHYYQNSTRRLVASIK